MDLLKTSIKKTVSAYNSTSRFVNQSYDNIEYTYTKLLFTGKCGNLNDIRNFWVEYYLLNKYFDYFLQGRDAFDEDYKFLIQKKINICKDCISYIKNNKDYNKLLYGSPIHEYFIFESRVLFIENQFKEITDRDNRIGIERKVQINILELLPELYDYILFLFQCYYYCSIFQAYHNNGEKKYARKSYERFSFFHSKLIDKSLQIVTRCRKIYSDSYIDLNNIASCKPVELNISVGNDLSSEYFNVCAYFGSILDSNRLQYGNDAISDANGIYYDSDQFVTISHTIFYFNIEKNEFYTPSI